MQVRLPADLAGARPPGPQTQGLCYISQLVLSEKDPHPGARASAQVQPSDGRPSLAVQFQAVQLSLLALGGKISAKLGVSVSGPGGHSDPPSPRGRHGAEGAAGPGGPVPHCPCPAPLWLPALGTYVLCASF